MKDLWIFSLVVIMAMSLLAIGCSEDEDPEPEKKDDSVVIQVGVAHDDLFGFQENRVIAEIWFSDSRGPVGTPVRSVVELDELDRFDENELTLIYELENNDAIKNDEMIVEDAFDDERTELEFIIPQVLSIPTVLNYKVYLRVGDPETGDYFEARGLYQFLVNQGTPAT
jgi:hypothetical protein